MKRFNLPFYIFPIIGIIGLLNYLPIFYCPEFLNNLYFNHKLAIITISLILLIVLTIFTIKRRIGLIIVGIYVIVLVFSKPIREFENKLVILFNDRKEVSEFRTPILGYKLERPNETSSNVNDISYDALFKFNEVFGTYDALIYKKDHGLTMESFEGDYSLYKIYNNDWWWYKKGD